MVQLATRVDDEQAAAFKDNARRLGMTPADALRIFVATFNEARGFPYEVRLRPQAEPFETEREAADFTTAAFRRAVDETR